MRLPLRNCESPLSLLPFVLAPLFVVVTPFDFLINDHINPIEKVWTYPVSQWEPFCKEAIFFKPYVRIYQGRNGPLLKERGPGFMMVRGMENIYVCTNGVIFLYYEEINHEGIKILNHGRSDRTPHYCQLYNFKLTAGRDHHRRHLVAIILVGHPDNYRAPSLQMFVAPVPTPNGTYHNETSISMISQYGECMIEKGEKKVLLRVRVNLPTNYTLLQDAIDKAVHEEDKIEEDYIAACNMNTRTQTGDESQLGAALEFREDPARIDQIQKNLIWDAKLVFKGCLPYPLFGMEQLNILENRSGSTPEALNEWGFYRNPLWYNKAYGNFELFWTDERKGLLQGDIASGIAALHMEDHLKPLETKLTELEDALAKETDPTKKAETQIEITELNKKIMVAPYQFNFAYLYGFGMGLQKNVSDGWFNALNLAVGPEDKPTAPAANKTYYEYVQLLTNYSASKQDLRYDPYNSAMKRVMEENWTKGKLLGYKLRKLSFELGRLVSNADWMWNQFKKIERKCEKAYLDLKQAIVKVEQGMKIPPVEDVSFTLEFDQIIGIKDNDEQQLFPCYVLPRMTDSCRLYKPHPLRACQLLRNIKGKGTKFNSTDAWRNDVFTNIEKVFEKACPYLQRDFVQGITNIIKGYLLGEPRGSGERAHIESNSKHFAGIYIAKIENSTYEEMAPTLRPMDPFWAQILDALAKCVGTVEPLEFWHDDSEELLEKGSLVFAQKYPNNTVNYIPVRDLHMSEQADIEFAFNWAIDMGWRMFATVLGSCVPAYQNKVPLITSRFYGLYIRDFLYPLRQIWMNRRDNPVFQVIFGKYYSSGLGEKWARNCMEASFVQSGERHMRPPRHLYVNAFTEMNFFTSGPMAGTLGSYANTFI